MEYLPQIQTIYQEYLETITELERNRKIGAGLLGIGKGPAEDPCNDHFVEALAKVLKQFAAENPDSAQVRCVLEYIYTIPQTHRDLKSAYWMLIAVHGLTEDLCALLQPGDASSLRKQYTGIYRRWERLPVQKQLLKTLEARI